MRRLTAALFGALCGAMLAFPQQAAQAALDALTLWARSVAPVLFPFMLCAVMISSRIRAGGAQLTALAWLCGSPGGARLITPLAPQGARALRCAAMTGTMSPLFLVGTVGAWLQSGAAGWRVLGCHLGGAWLAGLCFGRGKEPPAAPAPVPLGRAMTDCATALLSVAGCMALGSVAAAMGACALPRLPAGAAVALRCALEVTGGVHALAETALPLRVPLICAAVSFGGLSILLQNAAYWRTCGVSLGRLALLRLLHAAIAFCLCLLAEGLPL